MDGCPDGGGTTQLSLKIDNGKLETVLTNTNEKQV